MSVFLFFFFVRGKGWFEFEFSEDFLFYMDDNNKYGGVFFFKIEMRGLIGFIFI